MESENLQEYFSDLELVNPIEDTSHNELLYVWEGRDPNNGLKVPVFCYLKDPKVKETVPRNDEIGQSGGVTFGDYRVWMGSMFNFLTAGSDDIHMKTGVAMVRTDTVFLPWQQDTVLEALRRGSKIVLDLNGEKLSKYAITIGSN